MKLIRLALDPNGLLFLSLPGIADLALCQGLFTDQCIIGFQFYDYTLLTASTIRVRDSAVLTGYLANSTTGCPLLT